MLDFAVWIVVIAIVVLVFYFYFRHVAKKSALTLEKTETARKLGLHEPVSLHPHIDVNSCIGSGACIDACPEKDILGWVGGKSQTINASMCVGHGACALACPTQAITLYIGTEKRGVELPELTPEFETNVPLLFIAGELGGMGLIKNAVRQGIEAVNYAEKKLPAGRQAEYDILIIGAGPAGIAASLQAKKAGLKFLTIEQNTLGGTVYSFPRAKIVMTSPMDLPFAGKIKFSETSKDELLSLWKKVLRENDVVINEEEKAESIEKGNEIFRIKTAKGEYTALSVILAIGRRGSPRKLNVPGEEKAKVYYRLLEPELIANKDILVVGGGDSAIEAAVLLEQQGNRVTLSYRSDAFSRLKPGNLKNINQASEKARINILFKSNIKEIRDTQVAIITDAGDILEIPNDFVYIFAGGELPFQFLEKAGVRVNKKYGEALLSKK